MEIIKQSLNKRNYDDQLDFRSGKHILKDIIYYSTYVWILKRSRISPCILDLNYVRDLSLCKHNKGCSKLKFDHRYNFYQYITFYIQFIQTWFNKFFEPFQSRSLNSNEYLYDNICYTYKYRFHRIIIRVYRVPYLWFGKDY